MRTTFLSLFIVAAVPFAAARADDAFVSVDSLFRAPSTFETGEIDRHNAAVSDDDILSWMEFKVKYDAYALNEWRSQTRTSALRHQWLMEYRKSYQQMKMRIPVLSDFTAKELADIAASAPFFAQANAKARWARAQLPLVTTAQHRQIVQACVALKHARKGQKPLRGISMSETTNFPSQLSFLKLDMMRVQENHCYFFLQKGFGRGIGYLVDRQATGWTLSSFDQYLSWDLAEIMLIKSD